MQRRELLRGLGVAAGGVFYGGPAWAYAQAKKETAAATSIATPVRALMRKDGALFQPVTITLHRTTSGSSEVVTSFDGAVVDRRTIPEGALTTGVTTSFDVMMKPVDTARQMSVSVESGGATHTAVVTVRPVRRLLTYILPHSHHDLGYTDLQADVEEKQMRNITRGIELARKTAGYPEGSRFVWNLEVLWGADLFMRQRSEAEKAELLEAIRKGWISPNGSYANELTGLCRPEELLELFRYGTRLAKQTGVKIDSAMMSDVPGYSWGTVSAMAQAGIRYFSAAPNFFDRIGTFMVTWQDKPFWWVSPSGKEKVLVWVPWTGYAMSHVMKIGSEFVGRYQERLDDVQYPYEISCIRWSGHGDNAEPDPEISEFARSWNETYEWPKFAIASTSTAFTAMEQRYGSQLPSFRGDLTPYWEDGAGSSALETAMSRNAADRITQATALSAMIAPAGYAEPAYTAAWRDVLLYSEHTWGAWSSVSDSENPFTTKQWAFKREFAVDASKRSEELIASALGSHTAATGTGSTDVQNTTAIEIHNTTAIEIHNTTSWSRTEVVLVPQDLSSAGDHVADGHGRAVSSQRLSTGELAVLVTALPAFASARYTFSARPAHHAGATVHVRNGVLQNGLLRAGLDPQTGDLIDLTLHGVSQSLVDREKGALNQYLFLAGKDVSQVQHSGAATIVVEDSGPLVASVRVESSAPGCKSLVRRVRLAAGAGHLELSNTVDKKQAALNPHPGKADQGGSFAQSGSKESIQFAFPFQVAQGTMTMDVPLATMRPEADQLPGSCKNWLPVGRWIDVSNEDHGVTWATLDAPLVELGGITATMLGSQRDPSVWLKTIEPTQTVYSWVMNNHWGTNYRAYQEGPVTFRYALRPHRGAEMAAAHRFAIGLSQPLVVARASKQHAERAMGAASLLRVEPANVLVQTLKPSDDGRAWIVRLFGTASEAQRAKLFWREPPAGKSWMSNLAEEQVSPMGDDIPIARSELVTVRVERA